MFVGAVALLLACGSGTSVETAHTSTEGDGTSTTSGSSDTILDTTYPTSNMTASAGDPLATCECVVISDDGNYIDTDLCGGGGCGEIERGCDEQPVYGDPFCVDGGAPVLDITAVDCAIDLLIAGAPGYVSYFETPDGNYTYVGGVLKIGEDRIGVTRKFWGEDLDFHSSAHEVVPLRDAAYFLGCKELPDPRQRYACLKDWTAGPAIDTCDEPYPPG